MDDSALGLAFSLGALFLWSLSPFFFTSAGRRIGPFATNLLRLLLALPFLIAGLVAEIAWTWDSASFPHLSTCLFLILSGAVGLAIGDHFLYSALSESGPEHTSLVMTLSPAATAALAWLFLRELLSPVQLAGMGLVLLGVVGSTWQAGHARGPNAKGTWNGIAAGLCQAGGAILARQAFLMEEGLSPIFATNLRVGSAALMLLAAASFGGRLQTALAGARNPVVARRLLAGTLAGPVGGMLFYVAALKYQPAGIVSTITFMTPLLIIPLGTWHYGTRLGQRVLLGGAVALVGVVLLGINPR